MYERLKCVDDGIESVRLARDSRDEPNLLDEVAFWRNELALAATEVVAYATEADRLRAGLDARLRGEADERGIQAERVAHGYMDYQLGWHSITNHWLTNRLLHRLGPTVANTAPEPQRIGLLLPRATYDLSEGAIYYAYMGWDWMLQAAKLPYTRIDERIVRERGLSTLGLEVLIIPDETRAMDSRVAAEIERWVTDGGTLVASTIPATEDEYGRPRAESALAKVLGVADGGKVCEPVEGTPLTVTVPHGHYSGKWQEASDRKPEFQVLSPTTATVLAPYRGGKPAIAVHRFGAGEAFALGYPFGREAVECERTSIGFQRSYVWFVREPQLVARTAWLRRFFIRDLGFRPEYEVEYAEVERIEGVEAIAPGFHMPKGLSDDPGDPFFIRTVGDPRRDHEVRTVRESPDMAIRFFPRSRDGLSTRYLGISTREVHYLGPRATIQMILSKHTYRCRINEPRIRAIWDVARDVPVGFEKDEKGVSFTISLPSGHIAMLALSEGPKIQLFGSAPFPGREKPETIARCRELAGGTPPPETVILTRGDLRGWAKDLAGRETLASYGEERNRPAAEKLVAFLRSELGVDAKVIAQAVKKPPAPDAPIGREYESVDILIGDEWTNNDMGMLGAYWGIAYGAHLPFTATYAWPGPGRAVASLSRRYALIDEGGRIPFAYTHEYRLRLVDRRFPLVRRKLFIAANGADAEHAVDAVVDLLRK